ncbi:predicted protein [Uncinocarpus reesii 1704]|uniref:Uncharacterized protein n=1 Tax=Uncinocarpus reesii (strain UAMH 1704) TaxID=336963 RepID=C4JZZ4_UNCRE|nr:uncharacterized protein UREG_07745 [Uncinocarpus reesii 1704]EEP82880.1 predicted protein [Uncinocarpus reesii 1704]
MSSYHIPGIPVVPNDRAARRRNGPDFVSWPHKVSYKPAWVRPSSPVTSPSTRQVSISSSVDARNESFSSAGSSVVRAALSRNSRPTCPDTLPSRQVSVSSSVDARNESFSSAGSSVIRAAVKRNRSALSTASLPSRQVSVSSSVDARNESFSSAGSSVVRAALSRNVRSAPARPDAPPSRQVSVSSSIDARNESFSSAGSSIIRAAISRDARPAVPSRPSLAQRAAASRVASSNTRHNESFSSVGSSVGRTALRRPANSTDLARSCHHCSLRWIGPVLPLLNALVVVCACSQQCIIIHLHLLLHLLCLHATDDLLPTAGSGGWTQSFP